MFASQELDAVLIENKMTKNVAEKLLRLYVADIEWWPHVGVLYKRLCKKHSETATKKLLRDIVSFTILLPEFDKGYKVDKVTPESLLFAGASFHQFSKKDWFNELKNVVRRNQQITEYRGKVLALGAIDAIEYQPYCRQAYNWLCDAATESGLELKPELTEKFRNLVMIYGGIIITYIFTKHKDKVDSLPNWRSAYFFERLIFDIYSIDEVLKIKSAELRKTNKDMIRAIA